MTFFGVNCGVDGATSHTDDLCVPPKSSAPTGHTSTPEALALARRLELAVELTGATSTQSVSLAAGLSRASLSNMIRRLRDGEKATMQQAALTAIARATNVDPAWLVTGVGVPRPEAREGVPMRQHPAWPAVSSALQARHRELPPLAFDEVGDRVLCDPTDTLDDELLVDLARAWYRRSSREELMAAEKRSTERELAAARGQPVPASARASTKR